MAFAAAMRLLLLLCALASFGFGAVPPELAAALQSFRADPPPGWSYTVATSGEGRSTVERCDAAKPEFNRWKLLQKDGRAPTEEELRDYAATRSRRSRGGTAPKLVEQMDLGTLEVIRDDAERAIYRCRVKPGEAKDTIAQHLRGTLELHKPSRTLVVLELASANEFSPAFGVRTTAMSTRLTYSVPTAAQPSLPQQVTIRVRGRAFLFKSMDADMTVTYSEYEHARRGAGAPPSGN